MSENRNKKATARKTLVVTSVNFPIRSMAAGLLISEDQLRLDMRDGRGAWPFSEIWGARYCRMTAGDYIGETRGSTIIALGKGNIRFQRPMRFGASRFGTVEDLIRDLSEVRSVIVVDLRAFPMIRLCDIMSDDLIRAAEAGALTTNGWSGSRFDAWIAGRFSVRQKRMAPSKFRRARGPHKILQRGYGADIGLDEEAEIIVEKSEAAIVPPPEGEAAAPGPEGQAPGVEAADEGEAGTPPSIEGVAPDSSASSQSSEASRI